MLVMLSVSQSIVMICVPRDANHPLAHAAPTPLQPSSSTAGKVIAMGLLCTTRRTRSRNASPAAHMHDSRMKDAVRAPSRAGETTIRKPLASSEMKAFGGGS